jgi:hypothetical protein
MDIYIIIIKISIKNAPPGPGSEHRHWLKPLDDRADPQTN